MRMFRKDVIAKLNVENQKSCETREQFIERVIYERSKFLKDYLMKSKAEGYVLGLSGGVDSFVASALVKHAGLKLLSISLPYGKQYDIQDTLSCAIVLKPNNFITHNIKESVDSQISAILTNFDINTLAEDKVNLIKGNIMARERMAVQYSYGSIYNYLVIGTDHATESITGFYTKWGDGACDIAPLSGLTKDVIYDIAKFFHAPASIIEKAPSAGLWDGQTDELEIGISYQAICDYLNGKDISQEDEIKLEQIYDRTEHKRHMPATITDSWWKTNTTDLLVIDCQNDFITGSLACINGEKVVKNIKNYIDNNINKLNHIHFSLDSHSYKHCSFIENGGIFPQHCVNGTNGHRLHDSLNIDSFDLIVKSTKYYKGMKDDVEEFSAFNASKINKFTTTKLNEYLTRDVIVCGIATEYCVKETVLDLLDNGFNVKLLTNCLGYVNEKDHIKALKEMEEKGAILI